MNPDEGAGSYTATQTSNSDYVGASAIQVRLDTTRYLEELEANLSGKEIIGYRQDGEGNITPQYRQVMRPIMNIEGIKKIMYHFRTVVNSHTVQGNLTGQEYEELVYWDAIHTATDITINRPKWELGNMDTLGVYGTRTNMFRMFSSRLKDDKERQHLIPFMRVVESSTIEKPKEGMIKGLFSRGS